MITTGAGDGHVCIVYSTNIENGTFVTIDGNSGNNTNMVTTSSRKHLDSSFLVGIVDIHSVWKRLERNEKILFGFTSFNFSLVVFM